MIGKELAYTLYNGIVIWACGGTLIAIMLIMIIVEVLSIWSDD